MAEYRCELSESFLVRNLVAEKPSRWLWPKKSNAFKIASGARRSGQRSPLILIEQIQIPCSTHIKRWQIFGLNNCDRELERRERENSLVRITDRRLRFELVKPFSNWIVKNLLRSQVLLIPIYWSSCWFLKLSRRRKFSRSSVAISHLLKETQKFEDLGCKIVQIVWLKIGDSQFSLEFLSDFFPAKSSSIRVKQEILAKKFAEVNIRILAGIGVKRIALIGGCCINILVF